MSTQPADLPPPPYSESAAASPSSPFGTLRGPFNPSLYTSHLAAHLGTLPQRIREAQQVRQTRQAADDLDVVERILPHIEDFLADIANLATPPPCAELTFVPAPAVPAPWALSGADERRREGELVQLVRLDLPEPAKEGKQGGSNPAAAGPDAKGGSGGLSTSNTTSPSSLRAERDWSSTRNLFDEWGRWDGDTAQGGGGEQRPGSWWWRDERAARRLAAYLQPAQPVRTERRAVQAAVVQAKEEKKKGGGWGWGRKRSESSKSTSPSPQAVSPPSVPEQDDRVRMNVRADEITFRKENELGVWESMSGWGIVVVVTIKRS